MRILAPPPRWTRPGGRLASTDGASDETVVLGGEEREEVIRALMRLPHRQREVLVLRLASACST